MSKLNLLTDKVLLYGLAVSMVVTSVGISFSLIRGSEFNVEALNTKLKLSGVANKNKKLTEDLKQVSEELQQQKLPAGKRKKLKAIEQELEQAEEDIKEIESNIIEELPHDKQGIID